MEAEIFRQSAAIGVAARIASKFEKPADTDDLVDHCGFDFAIARIRAGDNMGPKESGSLPGLAGAFEQILRSRAA